MNSMNVEQANEFVDDNLAAIGTAFTFQNDNYRGPRLELQQIEMVVTKCRNVIRELRR